MNRDARWRWIAHVALLLSALSVCRPAAACGGFFCSRTPIDQTAERIIFTVNGDGTITAYVQIQYAGERDAFAWVVPVPSVPTLDTFPRLAIQALDLATEPAYRSHCGERLLAQGGSQLAHSSGVTVYSEQAVGPFQTVTLGGDSADELVTWLQDNDYRISKTMLPFINFYVREHMLFLAMKLLPDANVSDIEPIAMTYTADAPMIPLRLTAVAAKPELGVVAFILADQRYGPRNYGEVTISDDLIRFDERGGRNNYFALVSREIDRAGGHAFVTEYAHGTSDLLMQLRNSFVPVGNDDALKANDALIGLLERFPYLTRLYTRISPEEMTVDPVFVPASSQVDISNIHDSVADNPCATAPACTFTYCGTRGMCLPIDTRTDGCYCNAGTTAMLTQTFGAQGAVYCEPLASNVLDVTDEDAGPSVCKGTDCGQGTCTLINGNPTCQCTPGHVATVMTGTGDASSSSSVRCVSQTQPGLDAGVPVTIGNFDAGAHFLRDAGASPTSQTAGHVIASGGGAGCSCSIGRTASARAPMPWFLLAIFLNMRAARRLRAFRRIRTGER